MQKSRFVVRTTPIIAIDTKKDVLVIWLHMTTWNLTIYQTGRMRGSNSREKKSFFKDAWLMRSSGKDFARFWLQKELSGPQNTITGERKCLGVDSQNDREVQTTPKMVTDTKKDVETTYDPRMTSCDHLNLTVHQTIRSRGLNYGDPNLKNI